MLLDFFGVHPSICMSSSSSLWLPAFCDDMSTSAPFGDGAGRVYGYEGLYSGFGGGPGHGHGLDQPGRASTSTVLVLDGETEEMDAAVAAMEVSKVGGGGGGREEKATMALKSHSEAERRRRERINAHLATLRTMVPGTDKMDKAALLAEVVSHVKKLKSNAARIGRRCAVPSDADEVAVESPQVTSIGGDDDRLLVKAMLSCDDRADIFMDVKRALQPLGGTEVVGSEVTTLGGRVRFTFLVSCARGVATASVHDALQSVLDNGSSGLVDFAPRASLLNNKRRKVSTFESSSSSY